MSIGSDALTPAQKIKARAIGARMLLNEPATTKEIVAAVRGAGGGGPGDRYRNFIDRWLQGLRQDRCVEHRRHGLQTYWNYTPGGRERLEACVKSGEEVDARSPQADA